VTRWRRHDDEGADARAGVPVPGRISPRIVYRPTMRTTRPSHPDTSTLAGFITSSRRLVVRGRRRGTWCPPSAAFGIRLEAD